MIIQRTLVQLYSRDTTDSVESWLAMGIVHSPGPGTPSMAHPSTPSNYVPTSFQINPGFVRIHTDTHTALIKFFGPPFHKPTIHEPHSDLAVLFFFSELTKKKWAYT